MFRKQLQPLIRQLDHGVFFAGLNQLWRLLAGPIITIFCIPTFLTPSDQGLWFSIISLSAMTIFADLGFTNIVMQFSAHEFARISFGSKYELLGEREDIRRFGNLFRFAVRWIGTITVVLIPIIYAAGFFFLPGGLRKSVWVMPWTIFVLSSSIGLVLNLVLSFLEGCNQIANIQKIKTAGAVVNSILLLTLLISRAGLFALALASIVSNIVMSIMTLYRYRQLFRQPDMTLLGPIDKDWTRSVLKLLWRYAISWASGYFILQLYVPVMLKAQGEIAAGKIGLSWSVVSAAFSISNIWIYTIIPTINMNIERREWSALTSLVKKRLLLSVSTLLFGMASFIVFLYFIGKPIGIYDRFISITGLCVLSFSWILQLVVNTIATCLRGFKEEPFMLPSVVGALWISIACVLSAKYLPIDLYYLGYLTSFIIGLPWSLHLLVNKYKVIRVTQ